MYKRQTLCCNNNETCSDITCPPGTTADSSVANTPCAGAICDPTGSDNALCCNENSCAAVGDLGTGVVADDTNNNGCATDTVLNTSSDSTCEVKCDTSTYVAQSATVTCASDAAANDAPTGLPTCVPRALCSTIICAAGTSPDSSVALSLIHI